jgi:outer membrane usher protein FimD/PapC
MAAGNGTLSVAYVQTTKTGNDSSQISAKYATTLGGASLSVGYSSTDTNTLTNTNDITASISQSVGTGASVFAEFISRDGLVTSSDESSSILLGSSFAF